MGLVETVLVETVEEEATVAANHVLALAFGVALLIVGVLLVRFGSHAMLIASQSVRNAQNKRAVLWFWAFFLVAACAVILGTTWFMLVHVGFHYR